MATYSDTNFNASHYNLARPNYPPEFYDVLVEYHENKDSAKKLALDVGCGSGFATFTLTKIFDQVIATDLSSVMTAEAEANAKQVGIKNIQFFVSPSETSPESIEPASVDMITAAECAHWFDHDKFFSEAARILKPGGTLAYWFYKDPIFVGNPKADEVYDKYCYGDPRYMGPKWQQPGRNFLRTLLREKEPGAPDFENVVRNEFEPRSDPVSKTKLIIKRTCKVKDMESYVKSWSSYHTWMKDRVDDNRDIAEMFAAELKEVMGWDDDFEFEVVWGTVYTFATRV